MTSFNKNAQNPVMGVEPYADSDDTGDDEFLDEEMGAFPTELTTEQDLEEDDAFRAGEQAAQQKNAEQNLLPNEEGIREDPLETIARDPRKMGALLAQYKAQIKKNSDIYQFKVKDLNQARLKTGPRGGSNNNTNGSGGY